MTARRMAKDERRRQLLETAFEIIRTEGTNALTLVRLAERAGVSRPITYEHFKTREGLLLALYREYDEQLGRKIRDARQNGAESLEAVASVLSTAYVDGVLAAGPECDEVNAALSGNRETRDFRQSSRDFYLEEFRKAFEPFAPLSRRADLAMLTGILGAAEGLAAAAATRRISRAKAISASTAIMVSAIGQALQQS
ncbi:TetR/AcrR family transcriptional regulator [Amycolatopsis nigrescens]|uniref:TetR/AcrR family transcriptional regulator n=1 Tax=Amycolatopsis nigrescens TaxID=381445 RepID=UPI00039A346E|nr:TetR/AcrR family transcriptional regulator [Amycolatopsis nigrescens]